MRPASTRSYAEPTLAILGGGLLFFLRFGYDYGRGDQDEFLPLVLHHLDTSLLARDWFVQTQVEGIGIRTYFAGLVEALASLMPLWLAVLLLYVLTWIALGGAVYALAHRLTGDRMAAILTVLGALVLTPQWTLGGNDLAHRLLVPSMVAWALGLWGLTAFFNRRILWAAVLLGIATWMQALVGLHLALLVTALLLVALLPREHRPLARRNLLLFAGVFAASAAPALGPLVYQHVHPPPLPAGDHVSPFYIQAVFRAPHHYLPDAFPLPAVLSFGLIAGAGLLAFSFPQVRKLLTAPRETGLLLLFITLACLIGYLFTTVWPVFFIVKLQLFKTTVLAKLLFVLILSATVSRLMPTFLWRSAARWLAGPWPSFMALAGWTIVCVGLITGNPFIRSRALPWEHEKTPMAQLERWIRTQTPTEAIVAVPPSWDGFRTRARRAIVVNFKAFPFREDHMQGWYRRLLDMAPIAPPERGGAALLPLLDEAYEQLPAGALLERSERYGFSYVVRQTPLPSSHSFERVFQAEPWVVYRIRPREDR